MKRHVKPIAIGVGVGILLLILRYALNIEEHLFQTAVLVLSAAAVVGVVLFNILYMRGYRKRVRSQIALLEAGKPTEALADMEDMLEEVRQKKMKHMERLCRLNMTAVYCDLKQYDRAMERLQELSGERFYGNEELVYHLNLCACYFYLGQEEQGLLSYNLSQRLFDGYRTSKFYGGNVAVVTIWAMLAQGKNAQAEELLREARNKWDNPRLQEDYQMLEARMMRAET